MTREARQAVLDSYRDDVNRLVWAGALVVALYDGDGPLDEAIERLRAAITKTVPDAVDHIGECPGCVVCLSGER